MNHVVRLSFDAADQAALDAIGERLRALGWAVPVSVPRLLHKWQKLSTRVDRYTSMVEDYANNLMARDGLEIALGECDDPLRSKLWLVIAGADKEFLTRTQEHTGQSLGGRIRIDPSSKWWWRRRPVSGPLAELLSRPLPD